MKDLSKDIEKEYGPGKYGYFGKLWHGISHRSVSHWLIMVIALIPLLLVQQVSRSMIEAIALRMIETDSYHLLFELYEEDNFFDKQYRDGMVKKLRAIDGIERAYEEVRGVGMIRKGKTKAGISIRGISEQLLTDDTFRKYIRVIDGDFEISSKEEVMLGKAIAEKLGANVGDTVLLLTTRSNSLGGLPKVTRSKVRGIISTGYQELDKGWVFVSVERASEIIASEDQYWYIGMKIRDPFSLENDLILRSKKILNEGVGILARVRDAIKDDGYLHTWYSVNFSKFSLFADTKRILSMVMFITVMLAAVTLSSTMSMKVIDMEIDIAMLKGIGANPRSLERQIFFQGLKYGSVGAFFGALISIFLTAQINNIITAIDFFVNVMRRIFGYSSSISILNPEYYLTEIPFSLYPLDMLYVIVSAILLSIIAAWIPARRLRKVSALKIIRRH